MMEASELVASDQDINRSTLADNQDYSQYLRKVSGMSVTPFYWDWDNILKSFVHILYTFSLNVGLHYTFSFSIGLMTNDSNNSEHC